MMKNFAKIIVVAAMLALPSFGVAQELDKTEIEGMDLLFPPPEFETPYGLPDLYTPGVVDNNSWFDAFMLFAALSLATWLILKARSRRGLFLLSVFSLLYFGFYRKGCICPVGSTQNVAAGIFVPDVGVSLVVLSFFLMPLLFSLFFGRVFCASVCPLGAMQELVAIAPIRISPSVERVLGLGRYIYLGLAVVGVATQAGFIICRYDPFVGIYRMGHHFNMLLAGGAILMLGVFIGRPYCRFLCPYGVLLGWMSRMSKWHLEIPPSPCVECRLCEDSCPYNAIDMPTPEHLLESPAVGRKRVRKLVLATPLMILAGAVVGYAMYEPLSRMHPTVALSERVAAEDLGIAEVSGILNSETHRNSDVTTDTLNAEAGVVRERFKVGGMWLGAFLALIVATKLIGLSMVTKRSVFEPTKEGCYSCGRCIPYCPVEEGAPA
jgi:ferredoxin